MPSPYKVPYILWLGLWAIVFSDTFEFHFIIKPLYVPIESEFWNAIAEAAGLNVALLI